MDETWPLRPRGKCVRENLPASLTTRGWRSAGNRPVGYRVWVTASFWQRKSSEGEGCVKYLMTRGCGSAGNSNNTRQRWRRFFFLSNQSERKNRASCVKILQPAASLTPAPICGWLVLNHWADCYARWAARSLTPVLRWEVRPPRPPARVLRPYLWSWVWCERRSQMCVPSACPGSQTEREAWWPCWGASSP